MAVKFNIKNALADFKELGGKTKFEDSLEQVLKYMQNDKNLTTINEVAWLLATAKVESDYSLQRWESDYLCGDAGVPYDKQPCDRAIRYYRSTDGKKNYFDLGTDKNGMAYFGRGLIQLTGKGNYDKYGKKIGVDLINDGDKALEPKNSYNIASEYFKDRKVFKYANDENFPMARKSVKGSSSGWENAKKEYDRWIKVFNKKNVDFKITSKTRKERIKNIILFTSLGLIFVGLSVAFAYAIRTKKK